MATHQSVCVCVTPLNPLTMAELAKDGWHKSLGMGLKNKDEAVPECMKLLR